MTAKEERQVLANLALVCRFFSSLALPRIFAKMTLNGSPSASNGHSTTQASRFCVALLKGQEPAKTLAKYVRFCTISHWLVTEADLARHAFFSMYCDALSRMTQVESLELRSLVIERRLLKAMEKLHHLKYLSLSGCSFDPRLFPGEVKTFAQALCLQSLVVAVTKSEYGLPMFYDSFTCVFDFASLKSLEVDSWIIIRHLTERVAPLPLENLTIHIVSDPNLLPILFQKTPNLLELHIYRIVVPRPDFFDSLVVLSTSLPKLSVFDGPPALAAKIVPSRPVHKVWLLGTLISQSREPFSLPSLDGSLWKALGRSTTQMSEILIPKHLYTLQSLGDRLPCFSTLKISWCHANWVDDMLALNLKDAEAINTVSGCVLLGMAISKFLCRLDHL